MQSQRQFEILYLLMNRGAQTAGALAAHFEVSVRTIYRDVEALSMAGVPLYTQKGRNGGIHLMEGYVLDRALLDGEERREMISALQAMQATGAPATGQLLRKMDAFLPERSTQWLEIELMSWDTERADMLEVLRKAIVHRRVLAFDYWGRAQQRTQRVAEPLMLSFREHAWYLKAHCRLRNGPRLFKISRMQGLTLLEENFTRAYRQEDFDMAGLAADAPVVRLRLWFAPEAAYRVLDEFPAERVARNADGSFLVEASFIEDEWVYGFLLSFGPLVRVLSPERIAREVAALHFRALEKNIEKHDTQVSALGCYTGRNKKAGGTQSMENKTFCQSCAMPLEKPEDFGTEKDGARSAEYCQYCYKDGAFANECTMDEMIDFCAPMMVQSGSAPSEEEAKAQMRGYFPKLKRWAK